MSALHQRSHSVPVSFGEPGKSPTLPSPDDASLPSVPKPLVSQRMAVARNRRNPFTTNGDNGYIFGTTHTIMPMFEGSADSATASELHAHIQCKMERGFFLADKKWTCYRRNYFQLASSFALSPQPTSGSIYTNGRPVSQFFMKLSAHTSDSQKKSVDLIQLTPKRDKGPQTTPRLIELQPGGQLGAYPLEANRHQTATFERIQFKTATANNGKKRASQQYYCLKIELIAQTTDGDHIVVASCNSLPVVVRGRSPGHYADDRAHQRTITHEEEEDQQVLTPTSPAPSMQSLDAAAVAAAAAAPSYYSTSAAEHVPAFAHNGPMPTDYQHPHPAHRSPHHPHHPGYLPHARSQSVNDTAAASAGQHHPDDPRFQNGWDVAMHAFSMTSWSASRHRTDSAATFGSYMSLDSSTPPDTYHHYPPIYQTSSPHIPSHPGAPAGSWDYNKRMTNNVVIASPPEEEQPSSLYPATNENTHAMF